MYLETVGVVKSKDQPFHLGWPYVIYNFSPFEHFYLQLHPYKMHYI